MSTEEEKPSIPPEDWEPEYARSMFHQNKATDIPCSNICNRYIKPSVFAIPAAVANEFEEFCKLNKAACPVLYKSRPGEVSAPPLAETSDIRTDKQLYSLYRDAELIDVFTDLLHVPWDDMVTFYIGCSYSFEYMLTQSGIPVRHVIAHQNVPTYRSSINCQPVGIFKGKLIVTMRPLPRDLIQKAVEVTAVMDLNHGAPIHIGNPAMIGIKDLYSGYLGVDGPIIEEGDVPVFWACGVTTKEVWMPAKYPGISLSTCETTHGSLFISDKTVEGFNRENPPEFGSLEPKVVFLSETPLFASIVSDEAISQIERLSPSTTLTGIESRLLKYALLFSHSSKITIETCDINVLTNGNTISVLSLVKGLVAINKTVHFYVPAECCKMWQEALRENNLSCKHVMILELSPHESGIIENAVLLKPDQHVEPKDDQVLIQMRVKVTIKGLEISKPVFGANLPTTDCAPTLLPLDYGRLISEALYLLRSCPIHSRYVRHGVGEQPTVMKEKFLIQGR